MTKYKIVLVPFPFDDLSSTKVRPAVCLTDPITPKKHIVIAFITSKVLSVSLPTDIILNKSDSEFVLTGLRVSSTLRLHRLTTITTSIIKRELGQLQRFAML
ncbi:MAG: type II toxin-antitoxin system PemK/MazF family toxin [Symploca sp. SIO2E6]|nr:type II toxin-antitoxin system PemK/MazF family toxin [Symploca sp. SIO2E6]